MATDILVSQAVSSLINGVSSQPAHQRLPSQAEVQENILSEVSSGVLRRPPSEHVKLLTGSAAGGSPTGGLFMHTINRGTGAKFVALIEDQDINVYNLDTGVEVTVNDNADGSPGSYSYLDINTGAGETAQNSFEAITVADFTFILNKRKTAVMSGSADSARDNTHEFILVVKAPSPTGASNKLSLTLGVTKTTGAGSPSSSEDMMDNLCQAIASVDRPSNTIGTTAAGAFLNWKFTRVHDNVLHAWQFQAAAVTVTASDKWGDTLHTLISTGKNGEAPQVDAFSDLPRTGVDNFQVKVTGSDGSTEDEYYVTYNEEDKVWKESVRTGLDNNFDAKTMPHALVFNEGTGQFSFEPLVFPARQVGDLESAPLPSFIGSKVKDIVSHKGRLLLFADENVISSERSELFNFWPTTVTTIVDSDSFDVAGTGDRVALWDYAIPYRGKVSLFSVLGEMISELVGNENENLTIKNARIEERSAYTMAAVRPVSIADSLYFVVEHGTHSVVMRYASTDIDIFQAVSVTSHVQKYLPTSIVKIAAGRAESVFAFVSSSSTEDHRIYVYRFHFEGDSQIMASWSRWSFAAADVILNVDWIESVLYVLFERADGIHLEKIDLGKHDEEEGGATPLDYRVHLDSLVSIAGTYVAATDKTTWALPYDQLDAVGTYRVIKGGLWGDERGKQISGVVASVADEVSAIGDFSDHVCYIGREYDSEYEMSEIFLRDTTTQRTNPGSRTAGRLQLGQGSVLYEDTGTFTVEVRSTEDSDVYSHVFTSQFWNEAILGPTTLDKGKFDFHIGGDSRNARIIFKSSSFLPFELSSFEWEGRYYQRSSQA